MTNTRTKLFFHESQVKTDSHTTLTFTNAQYAPTGNETISFEYRFQIFEPSTNKSGFASTVGLVQSNGGSLLLIGSSNLSGPSDVGIAPGGTSLGVTIASNIIKFFLVDSANGIDATWDVWAEYYIL